MSVPTNRSNRPQTHSHRFRPALEVLDDRTTPTVLTVTTTTDTGLTTSPTTPFGPGTAGDLRNAIYEADQNPGTQNIIDLTHVSGCRPAVSRPRTRALPWAEECHPAG